MIHMVSTEFKALRLRWHSDFLNVVDDAFIGWHIQSYS
jgi:hypothetical protein